MIGFGIRIVSYRIITGGYYDAAGVLSWLLFNLGSLTLVALLSLSLDSGLWEHVIGILSSHVSSSICILDFYSYFLRQIYLCYVLLHSSGWKGDGFVVSGGDYAEEAVVLCAVEWHLMG